MKNASVSVGGLVQLIVMVALVAFVAANPAYAQFNKANSVMVIVKNILVGVGLLICTCAFMWAGYKMMWQHAKWSEISNIVIGAIIVSGAAELGAILMA
jgi:type IV secretion system protein VirB2